MRQGFTAFVVLVSITCALGCDSKRDEHAGHDHSSHKGHDEDKHAKPQHGGLVLEVGEETAHVEFVHEAKAGRVVLYLSGKDGKTPLRVSDPPTLRLVTTGGTKNVVAVGRDVREGKASEFTMTDDALKSDPLKGSLVLEIDGKRYDVEVKEEHE